MRVTIELDYKGEKSKHGFAIKDEYCKDAPREDLVKFVKTSLSALGRYLTDNDLAFGGIHGAELPEEK